MGTSKQKPAAVLSPVTSLIRILWRPQNRGLALTAAVVMAAIGGFVYSWQRWGEPATRSAGYIVTPEKIEITPPPAWIHAKIKDEVIRTAGINRLDLRDRKVVEQIAQAFSLHPWVAKVVRVEKRFPALVRVELAYRRPVAAVEVEPRGKRGLIFIDEQSVLLPDADFAPGQAKDYLRIASHNELPAAGYGAPWGSQRIAGAARVAAAWEKRWQPLGLYRIDSVVAPGGLFTYELQTQRQVRVLWGSGHGNESAREPSAEQKITALEQLVRDKGPLDRDDAPQLIDLRELAGAVTHAARQSQMPQR
jgi:hypothetical protein